MERRLAAILAADVVGYSRLMGVDEAATLAALKAHRKELVDAQDRRASGAHRQADRRRHAGRVPERGERRRLRRRDPAARCASATPMCRRTGASSSASASISATSSSRATTFSATASTWRRGWRASPRRAASPSRRGARPCRQPARPRLRGHRRAGAEEHRAAGQGLSRGARRRSSPAAASLAAQRTVRQATSRRSPSCPSPI